jgi:acyl-coenzyme A thioesterase PaaI-like protein
VTSLQDDADDAGLHALVVAGTPFARTLAPRVVSLNAGEVVLEVDAPTSLHNHVGGPHAATLFGFAETAAAGVVLTLFEDLVGSGAVPLIKSAKIAYSAIAQGPVTAKATFVGDEAGVRASFAQRGVAVFPVEVAVTTADGAETAKMLAQMALKRL